MTTGRAEALHGRWARWLYRTGRPSRLAAAMNGMWARLARRGVGPGPLTTLEVSGRHSGKVVDLPIMVTEYDGARYAVAMLGERSSWVANVRAAEGRAVLQRGRARSAVRLVEIPAAARAPVLKRYVEIAPGGRPHIPVDRRAPIADFAGVADRYPVFRIEPAAPGSGP